MLFHWEMTTRLGAASSNTSALPPRTLLFAARFLIFSRQDCSNWSNCEAQPVVRERLLRHNAINSDFPIRFQTFCLVRVGLLAGVGSDRSPVRDDRRTYFSCVC
jgi:hypothetical protein